MNRRKSHLTLGLVTVEDQLVEIVNHSLLLFTLNIESFTFLVDFVNLIDEEKNDPLWNGQKKKSFEIYFERNWRMSFKSLWTYIVYDLRMLYSETILWHLMTSYDSSGALHGATVPRTQVSQTCSRLTSIYMKGVSWGLLYNNIT